MCPGLRPPREILLQAGRLADALQSAEQAVHCDPENSSYTLDRAEILARMDHRAEAMRLTKEVVAQADLPPALKAHALCQLGDLTLASMHDDKHALEAAPGSNQGRGASDH